MKKNKQRRHKMLTKRQSQLKIRVRKQRGGICPCALQQSQRQKNQQQGGFAVALINQFTAAASLLTPIAFALGIKAYRDSKRGSKTRRAR